MNVVDSHYRLQNDTVMLNETYVVSRDDSEPNLSSSFDISHRDVDDTPPIQEQYDCVLGLYILRRR